jgi:hypothetical protein
MDARMGDSLFLDSQKRESGWRGMRGFRAGQIGLLFPIEVVRIIP